MKSFWITSLLLNVMLLPSARAEQQGINLAVVDVDSVPFLMGKGDRLANPPGLAVELVQQVVTAAGIRAQIQRLPQLRMLKELEEGTIDGAFIFSYTPDRAQIYVYPMNGNQPDSSLRVTHIRYSPYSVKGGSASWDGEKFNGINAPVGVNTGWVMSTTLRDKGLPADDGGRGFTQKTLPS